MRATTQPGIEDLYREHALGLVRFALLLTGDRATAEDVVQDAFLGLHRHWDEVKDPGRVLAYLRTAVVNGSRSRYRRHLVARRLRPEPLAMVQSAEALVLAGEDRRALLARPTRRRPKPHTRQISSCKSGRAGDAGNNGTRRSGSDLASPTAASLRASASFDKDGEDPPGMSTGILSLCHGARRSVRPASRPSLGCSHSQVRACA